MDKVLNLSFDRSAAKYIEIVSKAYPAFVSDRLGKEFIMSSAIKPLNPDWQICGLAVTSKGPDLTVRRAAIDTMRQNDVLVVSAGGSSDWASFGDGTAAKIHARGGQAAVIDGSTRDSRFLRKMNFPTFCINTTARNYYYPHGMDNGAVNVGVVVGGVHVNPGDIIFGDQDGVVVIPKERAAEIANRIEKDLPSEIAERLSITPNFLNNVKDLLIEKGYRINE
jgi:4-hydroxy-4-methyl-2-oxoglutarate aldolase